MDRIETAEITAAFEGCWRAAGRHLLKAAKESHLEPVWIKARLEPPFLEHISFRLGNQLFFVRLEDADRREEFPGNLSGLVAIAEGCAGHACVLPLRRLADGWLPSRSGWGLLHAEKRTVVTPPELITDAPIEMTDWELHDMAVGVVRSALQDAGRKIMSSQGNPSVDPSLWFVGDRGPEFVVVRAVRYPIAEAPRPGNWAEIARGCASLSSRGNFASVAIANAEDQFDPGGAGVLPLWRGGPMYVKYEGLVQIRCP